MSWTCPKCGAEKNMKGSHEFYCKGKKAEVVVHEVEVPIKKEDPKIKDPWAQIVKQPAERLPHDGCPKCGCVNTLEKLGPYTEPVQAYRCKICGFGHSWNEVTDVAV